ncbi:MAG: hypothetical protein EBV24_10400 [Actinobacteria bacterium]|nr:hypothetical protein [Actinomycetota bacterium]
MTAWLALSGCAVTSVRDTNKIRSAEELADSLLTEEDLSGDWALTMGPDGVALPASGVITDVEREMLPQVELCAEAGQAARDAIDSLKWQGFRQLDKVVDDPIDPPADREGHMEFVQQFLMSADPDDLESAFGRRPADRDTCANRGGGRWRDVEHLFGSRTRRRCIDVDHSGRHRPW